MTKTTKPIRTMLSILATPDITGIRTATLMNQEHTVIPCIALVEGVLWPVNAPSPELALAEEFGRFPQGWNGRPVMYDHPKINGQAVSASSPDILQDTSFGQLFNTELQDTGKLYTEIWVNEARIAQLSEEGQDVIKRLKEGDETIEVSTGLFTMSEITDGEYKGRPYKAVWRNIVPDHLAILPTGTVGACSVADGCGAPRSNEASSDTTNKFIPVMRAAQLVTNCSCATAKKDDTGDDQVSTFKRLMELGANIFNFKSNSVGMSDRDTHIAIEAALANLTDDFYYVLVIYPSTATTGTFVYEKGFDNKLFETSYLISESGVISIGLTPIQVRPQTTFIPVQTTNSTEQENAMNEKLVNELIANAGTQYSEEDREWLNTLEDSQLERMAPIEVDTATADADATAKAEAAIAAAAELAANANTDADASNDAKPHVTTNEYIASAPDEIRQVLESGVHMHRQRKNTLVKALTANARCKFTADQLNAKSVQELENIAAMAPEITFEGAGPAITDNAEGEEKNYTEAPSIFAVK